LSRAIGIRRQRFRIQPDAVVITAIGGEIESADRSADRWRTAHVDRSRPLAPLQNVEFGVEFGSGLIFNIVENLNVEMWDLTPIQRFARK
jgi:hypothetical protein